MSDCDIVKLFRWDSPRISIVPFGNPFSTDFIVYPVIHKMFGIPCLVLPSQIMMWTLSHNFTLNTILIST